MRVEEHRRVARAQALDQRAHVAAADRIERRRRLVEEHDLRFTE